jgi:hypothetical protein
MSEWNKSSEEERIEKWREFRESLNDLNDEELLNNVAQFFASVPLGARCVDYYTPESWPTPWELLYHKLYCSSSISLLIYHTLCIVLGNDRVSIVLADTGTDCLLMPIVDKKYIFNYELGKVNKIKDHQIEVIDDFADVEIEQVQ